MLMMSPRDGGEAVVEDRAGAMVVQEASGFPTSLLHVVCARCMWGQHRLVSASCMYKLTSQTRSRQVWASLVPSTRPDCECGLPSGHVKSPTGVKSPTLLS